MCILYLILKEKLEEEEKQRMRCITVLAELHLSDV